MVASATLLPGFSQGAYTPCLVLLFSVLRPLQAADAGAFPRTGRRSNGGKYKRCSVRCQEALRRGKGDPLRGWQGESCRGKPCGSEGHPRRQRQGNP